MSGTIHILGSGNAFNTDGRASQGLLVRPGGGSPFLVDAGPTSALSLASHEGVYDELERLFVTHLHGDHIAGWPFLLLNLRFVAARERALPVHGAAGTAERLDGLMRLCYPELAREGALGFDVRYDEIPVAPATGLSAGGTGFDVVPLEHVGSSLGYRFHLREATVGISGDTCWCAGLEELARGCDLLVLECTTVEPTPYTHVSLRELRERRERLEVPRVVLVHLTDAVEAALAARPLGGVRAARDGMELRL